MQFHTVTVQTEPNTKAIIYPEGGVSYFYKRPDFPGWLCEEPEDVPPELEALALSVRAHLLKRIRRPSERI